MSVGMKNPVFSILVVSVILAAVFGVPALAAAPTEFWGTITVDGKPAPSGSIIIAMIGGNERGRIVTTIPGGYGGIGPNDERLVVTATTADLAQTKAPVVEFYVNNRKTHETAEFIEGTVQGLELVVGGEPVVQNTPIRTILPATRAVTGGATSSQQGIPAKSTPGQAVQTVRSSATPQPTVQVRLPTELPTLKSVQEGSLPPLLPDIPSGNRTYTLAAALGLLVIIANLLLVFFFWLYRRGERKRN